MPREIKEQRVTDSEGRYILLKQNQDARLLRSLTLNEFIIAFSKYKNIMCEVYPSRRQELDAYERDIVEMASTTRGSAFYEYQKAFSARASALLLQRNINIDWSIRDTKLFATIFAGQTVVRCELCGSVTHATHFCSKAKMGSNPYAQNTNGKTKQTTSNMDVQGRPKISFKGKEICNNFNGPNGCHRNLCNLLHICSECKLNNHSASNCNKAKIKTKDHPQTDKQ